MDEKTIDGLLGAIVYLTKRVNMLEILVEALETHPERKR